jgi:hypothetical protein
MKVEIKDNCPLNKFKPCKKFDCAWYTAVQGTNPNTGEFVNEWGCAMAWLPILMIEGSQQTRQAGAAIESFRNEMVKSNEQHMEFLIQQAKNEQETLKLDYENIKVIGKQDD